MLVFGEHEDAGPAPFCFDTWFTNGRAGTTILFVRTVGPIIFAPMQSYLLDYVKTSQGEYPNWTAAENVRLGNSSGEIGDALKELGLARARIGVIGLEPYVPWHPEGFVSYNLWNALLARFPDADSKPVGLIFARLMMPLSEEEIAVVRHSGSIGDAMARRWSNLPDQGFPRPKSTLRQSLRL